MATSAGANVYLNGTVAAERLRSARTRVVSASTDLRASSTQLLYAITLPEYLEVWITPADWNDREERVVTRVGTGFVVDYRDAEGRLVTVDGVFRTATPDRIVFTWCRQWPGKTRRSQITIDLRERGGVTKLELSQVGVMFDGEYRWLRQTWNLSLRRLAWLFQGGRNSAFDARPDKPASSIHTHLSRVSLL